MEVVVLGDPAAVARRVAALVAEAIDAAGSASGRATVALSGGSSPWPMIDELTSYPLPWSALDVVQVDERVASRDSDARNRTRLDRHLAPARRAGARFHPMPVDDPDPARLEAGAREYGRLVARLAGEPPVLDVVHLGLGPDGHVASLFPDDPALDAGAHTVAVTDEHLGYRRMTLTASVLSGARRVVWLVVGDAPSSAVRRLVAADPAIPASLVARGAGDRAILVCDRAAAKEL
ncbi:MAG TPA: 6-phosphogluconolactonase [Acidimicrobiia bacterium]|nr:6-phosphogluconolactonase [Acidimicrobiia bacterium]